MKRNTLILTAAVLGIGALAATTTLAHGPGQGQGYGMGMGQHMMQGQGQGYGMMQGYGPGQQDCLANQALETPLTVDDVRANLEKRLELKANDRLKVGKVVETDEQTITAEIVTVDDSLVRKIQIDKTTGRHAPVK